LDRVETHLPVIFEGKDLYYHTPIRLISHWALSSADDSSPKIFYLSGAAGCGKSYIAGEIIKAFSGLGFFGAYFSFNHHTRKGMKSKQLLESFPATIMHQISTVEPDVERLMAQEIKTLSGAETLDSKFQKLVVNPLRNLRSNNLPHWQPDYPLLIVLDDLNSCTSEVLELLLNFLSDPIMEKLPSYIRFLVLNRPSEEVNRRIGKVGFEILPSAMHGEESLCSSSTPAERPETSSVHSSVHSGRQGEYFQVAYLNAHCEL
jgi:AAA ATPase domain